MADRAQGMQSFAEGMLMAGHRAAHLLPLASLPMQAVLTHQWSARCTQCRWQRPVCRAGAAGLRRGGERPGKQLLSCPSRHGMACLMKDCGRKRGHLPCSPPARKVRMSYAHCIAAAEGGFV